MTWMETLLIVAGMSLDILGSVACQGARIAKIHFKRLGLLCLLYAVWQTGALYLGTVLANVVQIYDIKEYPVSTGEIIAMVIFIILGLRMIRKIIKKEEVEEHRQEMISTKETLKILGWVTLYTILAGIAIGFLDTALILLLPMVAIVTVGMVVLGVYSGYRFGAGFRTKTYLLGAICLMAGALDVILRYLVFA